MKLARQGWMKKGDGKASEANRNREALKSEMARQSLQKKGDQGRPKQ